MKNDLYEPEPAKRVYIPKEKGGKRPLGIPTLKDRVVQQTLKLIIEPILESDFYDCSIGFRPNRNCHDALAVIYNRIQPRNKYYWVMEGDIRGCFDNINHKILLRIIKRRIKDKRVLSLIRKILSTGYIEDGKINKPGFGLPKIGTPQDGIISPLFANIYLHQFDKWLNNNYGSKLTPYQKRKRRRQKGGGNAILIRYADDFVILWNGNKENLETMKGQVKLFLKQELELSPYISDEYWIGKKLALKRDKYKCRNCGARVTVGVNEHCHHIDGNSNNHSLGNLATLCITCHYLTFGKGHELNL